MGEITYLAYRQAGFPTAEQRRQRFQAALRFYVRYGVHERATALLEEALPVAKEIALIEGRTSWDARQGERR